MEKTTISFISHRNHSNDDFEYIFLPKTSCKVVGEDNEYILVRINQNFKSAVVPKKGN